MRKSMERRWSREVDDTLCRPLAYTRCPGMQGCICKNEGEEILLVGRKTSDRVGIRRGGFRVADTHAHICIDARVRTVNEEDVFLFAT